MKTEELLQIANWAVTLTRKVIPYSSNLPDRHAQPLHRSIKIRMVRKSPQTLAEKALLKEIRSWNLDLSSDKDRNDLRNSLFYVDTFKDYLSLQSINAILSEMPHWKTKTSSPQEYVEKCAARALKEGIGNCGEISCYVLMLLNEYPKEGIPEKNLPPITENIPIERVNFNGREEHSFVVINRDLSKDLSDIKSWNDDAIIVDAWTKECYTKKQLFENKTQAEIDWIVNTLKRLKHVAPSDRYIYDIGENTHSRRWQYRNFEALRKKTAPKPWRPIRLMDVTSRPSAPEKLPKTKPFIQFKTTSGASTSPLKENFIATANKGMKKLKFEEIRSFYLDNPELLTLSDPFGKPKTFTHGYGNLERFGYNFFDRIDAGPLLGKARIIAISENKLWLMCDDSQLLSIDLRTLHKIPFKKIWDDYEITSDILLRYETQHPPGSETTSNETPSSSPKP